MIHMENTVVLPFVGFSFMPVRADGKSISHFATFLKVKQRPKKSIAALKKENRVKNLRKFPVEKILGKLVHRKASEV